MSVSVDVRLDKGEFDLDTAFDVPMSGFTAIFGPSGCGKTTLLRVIAGLEPAAVGRVRIGDATWQEGARSLPPHRRRVGFVFQQPVLFGHLDVRANLDYALHRRRTDGTGLSVEEALDQLGIAALRNRRLSTLSGGERQRVAIAQALLSNPRLLLMDEPLSALDQASRSVLLPYLDQMQRELAIPVLYVSHALDEVARLTEHMVLMRDGRVVTSGDINALLTRLDLPMAHGRNAEAVIRAAVYAQDDADQLTELQFTGGRLWVPRIELPAGAPVRLRIRARDVSLALQPVSGTSVLNNLSVVVAEVDDDGPAQVMVSLRAGDQILLTRVTRRSQRLLDIVPGKTMYAQVKSVALMA